MDRVMVRRQGSSRCNGRIYPSVFLKEGARGLLQGGRIR